MEYVAVFAYSGVISKGLGTLVVFFVNWFWVCCRREGEGPGFSGTNSDSGRWLLVNKRRVEEFVQQCWGSSVTVSDFVSSFICCQYWRQMHFLRHQRYTKNSQSLIYFTEACIFSTNHMLARYRQYEIQTCLLRSHILIT